MGLLLGVGTPAYAQLGTVDVGLHIRYSNLDEDLATDNGIGFGGRIGAFFTKHLALELETASFSGGSVGGDTKLQPLYIRLAAHFPVKGKWSGIVGAAILNDKTEPPGGTSYTDKGISLNLGAMYSLANSFSARADLIGDVVKEPFMEELNSRNYITGNWHLNIGVNYRFAFLNRGGSN
ncbi:MAG TPA: outer membrane beta-barrel protein [Gemmatimonadaceae bacterium]|nr:outer membrane beta-barrel protein [Gemmatimonadaceae bacterium]